MAKSYWSGVVCDTDKSRSAIKSWFSPLCDDLTPIKAEILCDIETDREKKLRAVMVDADGKQRVATRTINKGGYTIALSAPLADIVKRPHSMIADRPMQIKKEAA